MTPRARHLYSAPYGVLQGEGVGSGISSPDEGGIVPVTYDRRTFLTHSAATAGGIAMAGTVVDSLVADAASAAGLAAHYTPTLGGSLNVGVSSSPPSTSPMNGWQGHWDAAGYYVGSAIYDPLLYVKPDGSGIMPGLALDAVGSNSFRTWTLHLRTGVRFHDGSIFNAQCVVDNFNYRGLAVKLAIQGIINNIKVVSAGSPTLGGGTIEIDLANSFFSFPTSLAEGQGNFIASSAMVKGHTATPTGSGPFKVASWDLTTYGSTANLVANPTYWRQDSAGRKLPYLSSLHFKVLTDEPSRQASLNSGGIDMGAFYVGATIKQNKSNSSVVCVDDNLGLREPAKTLILCNVKAAGPVSDVGVRTALAHALNRSTYFHSIDASVGQTVDGIFRKTSSWYVAPGYPAGGTATDISAAKTLVNHYKSTHGGSCSLVMSYDAGSTPSHNQFLFVQSAAASVGITVTGITYDQATLINQVIVKNYQVAGWSQFGCIIPASNYVWFAGLYVGKTLYANYVNFAQLADPVVQTNLIAALKASTVAAQKTAWTKVNKQFAKDVPYLWLDTTVAQWAAKKNVQNWASPTKPTGTSVKSSALCLSIHNGGIPDWAEIYL